jgi:hypothetical protein
LVIFTIGFFATSDAFAQSVCCLEVSTNRSTYDQGDTVTLNLELEGIANSDWRSNNPVSWTITSYYHTSNSTYNIVAQGDTVLNQQGNDMLKASTAFNTNNWDWSGQYTITANVASYETTTTVLLKSNTPVPSVPIAQSSADTSAMCCLGVGTGHEQYWINDPDTDVINGKGYNASDRGKAPRVSFGMEGYATSEWRANNNAIIQIFDSEQNLLASEEAGFNAPNSQNIMTGYYQFSDNALNHATTSGVYTASVTIGTLQGTENFFFHADCIAYCDGNDPDWRVVKPSSSSTTTTTPEPEPEATPEPEQTTTTTTTTTTTEEAIPDWVRNIFIWYANEQISESELIGAIEFLVNQGIINLE